MWDIVEMMWNEIKQAEHSNEVCGGASCSYKAFNQDTQITDKVGCSEVVCGFSGMQ